MNPATCKPLPHISEEDIKRFLSKIDQRGPDECWPWIGAVQLGYGVLYFGPRAIKATRIALFLKDGRDPFPLLGCHTCESRYQPGDISCRKCCNPEHLYAGTHADNAADLVNSKRGPLGERHPRCKLTAEKVMSIRRRYAQENISHVELAIEFGINPGAISRIIQRQTWRHVPYFLP